MARAYEKEPEEKDRYSKTVFEILCSFVREETSRGEYKVKNEKKFQLEGKALSASLHHDDIKKATSLTVVQTIINRLFRRADSEELYGKYYEDINLRHAVLRKVELYNAIMRKLDDNGNAVRRKVDLRDVDLRGCDLQGIDLQGARLNRAKLQGAWLVGAKLQGANLTGADLRGAVLDGAIFSKDTDLELADIRGIQSNIGTIYSIQPLADGLMKGAHLTQAQRNFFFEEGYLPTDWSGIAFEDDISEEDKNKWFAGRLEKEAGRVFNEGIVATDFTHDDKTKLATELELDITKKQRNRVVKPETAIEN
jgi:uncharacterized protein YjbI with pentapeptide repeats